MVLSRLSKMQKAKSEQAPFNVADERKMKRFTNFDSLKISFESISNPNPSQKLRIHSILT